MCLSKTAWSPDHAPQSIIIVNVSVSPEKNLIAKQSPVPMRYMRTSAWVMALPVDLGAGFGEAVFFLAMR